MFERILLAIDDSPSSEVAVSFATAFAERTGASVHVLYVNELLVGGQGVTLHTKAEAARLVSDAVDALREAGIRAGGSVIVASYRHVPNRIVETAQETSAEAIVLGSRRHRRLSRLFSQQVRERTIRLTTLPVLAAPSPLKIAARGQQELIDLMRLEFDRETRVSP